MSEADFEYCRVQLAETDRDRYLSSLYAPDAKRPYLQALYAFNAELASIANRVRDVLPGEIRMQWWRDVLTGGEYSGEGAPVVNALLQTIHDCALPVSAFQTYIDARIGDLYADPLLTRTELEAYCGETASAIVQLAGLCCDREGGRLLSDAAGHGGCAMGIAGIIRLIPIHRARGKCMIPQDMLAAAGLDAETFLRGDDRDGLKSVVEMMIALAKEHLLRFQASAKELPAKMRPALLPVALTPAYLGQIKPDRPFDQAAELSDLRRQWVLIRRAARGW